MIKGWGLLLIVLLTIVSAACASNEGESTAASVQGGSLVSGSGSASPPASPEESLQPSSPLPTSDAEGVGTPSALTVAPPGTEILRDINVYVYTEDTPRSQPELSSVYYEDSDLRFLQNWLSGAGDPVDFPQGHKISWIKVIGYGFEKDGSFSRNEAYMYVVFEDGTGYIKSIDSRESYLSLSLYPYDESMNELIIRRMGYGGWRKMGDTNHLL